MDKIGLWIRLIAVVAVIGAIVVADTAFVY